MVNDACSIPQRPSVGYTLQASQWHSCQVLLDVDEMKDLLAHLGQFSIVQVSGVIPYREAILSKEDFLEGYRQYVFALKEGKYPDEPSLRSVFSSVFTTTLDVLYAVPLKVEGQCLIKVTHPVVQLQNHRLHFSSADGKFRSMVFGSETLCWGLQFSFPRLFQDEKSQVYQVREGDQFPNAALFRQLQLWMRHHTRATPFDVGGKKIFSSARLGYRCFPWINNHPQLGQFQVSCQ